MALLFLLGVISLQGGDKPSKKLRQDYQLKPDQTAELKSAKLVTAKQSCENWALAAGLETMLADKGVALDQSFWVMRLNYGEVCADLPSMDALAKVVDDEFVLDDGRHVRLELQYTDGAPGRVDSIIAGLQQQQAALMIWRGHPYYISGVTYDEYIGRDGGRLFEIKELRLANTFAGKPGVAFERGRDDAGEIQEIVTVSVNPT
ncbi:MAG TPA: hypothetical protein VN669_00655 [Candidatus Acidoferrales bacterium]|nr:hypothetical protein [Candidatus Acidoferrales bacterium]